MKMLKLIFRRRPDEGNPHVRLRFAEEDAWPQVASWGWRKCRTLALFTLVIAVIFAFEVRGDVSEKLVRDIRTLESLRTNQTPAQSKLATCFRVRLAKARGDVSSYPEKMRETRSQESGELLECELEVTEVSDNLKRFVIGCGGVVVSSSLRWKVMHVRLPLSSLESVAEREDVLAVRRAAGSFKKKVNTSRGDTAHKAASARQVYGVSGSGVKIGVISDSVRHMADVQASGDLPSSVDVLDDGIGVSDQGEGTAMLEIVHDLAPNAGLAFCACGSSQAQMADNIARLANAGCRVVVDDIGFFAEPTFSSGPIEVAATEFVSAGGVYATSAGNSYNADAGDNGVWEGPFTASSGDATLHEFSAGNSRNKLTYQNRPWISLEWNDAWSGSSNDYALYLYDAGGNVVAYSDDTQSGLSGHRPQEMLHTSDLPSSCGGSFKGLFLAVRKKASADVRRIRINTFGGSLAFEQGGSTYGHSCAERVLSVGAAPVPSGNSSFSPTTVPANYSSDGPAWRFFDVTGSAIAGGRMLRKPDVLGAATVACATPGFESFSGTSAAAPHIAAIVGLMLEANAEMTPQDVFEVLTNSTFSASGWSPSAGYGALNAEAAVSNALSRVVAGLGHLYVATGGNDANDGLSWATAKRTIQAAIDVAEEGAVIMVSDGTYAPIVSGGKPIEIRSVNGAASTVIDGALGSGVRCADLNPATGTVLVGFTLVNGRATGDKGGGAYCGTLNYCVLSNNVAGWGGAVHSSKLNNCLVVGNKANYGGGSNSSILLNCTVVGNVAMSNGGGAVIGGAMTRNCIIWGNEAPEDVDVCGSPCSYTCSGVLQSGTGNVAADPKFVDRAKGDYRLSADSPCINVGLDSAVAVQVDLDGNPRVVGGAVDMGAYEWQGMSVVRPANDDFANATAISGASGSLTASSENATKETGEPYHGISSATNSVWWKWTATSAGSMTITTEGSGFDTGLGVYTGSSVSALTKVVSNDDVVSGTYWSSVTFSAVAGTTYYIAVAGYKGATGSVKLNWAFGGTPSMYSITYALGGGTHGTTHPASATYGTAFYVSAPTRSGYTFAGWTVTSGLNASTAKWGTSSNPSTAISSSSTKCVNGATGNVYFKNLTSTANGSVTLTANWTADIPLSTALDNAALTFTTGGDAGWFGQSVTKHDGTDAAQSGPIMDSQSSWLQTTVTGPGTISFWWYASSESVTWDYLSFSVDGVQSNKIGGTSCSWTQCSYALGAGNHVLKWTYRKDGSVSSGLDAGFVDQVVWTPATGGEDESVVSTFEGMDIGTPVTTGTCEPSGGGASHWLAVDAVDNESLVKDYDSLHVPMYEGACGQPFGLAGQGDRYLTLDTALPLWRTVNPIVGDSVEPRTVGDSLTFDFLGILGAADSEPDLDWMGTLSNEIPKHSNALIRRECVCLLDDKIAVYLLEDEETEEVSLCVRAGSWNATTGQVEERVFRYAPVGLDPYAWNRVSIKVTTVDGRLRFFVYFNGELLSDEAYHARPQVGTALTVTALGFVGQGCFDNIVIGSRDPVFAGTQTYDVIYNPGTYGSGTQQTATKTNGVALTLKGAIFTRTGYTQTGWSTSSTGASKAYNLGAAYTTDAAITLYPYWTANTYSITYALGGGTHGATHPASATYGTAFYVSAPTRSGYTFAGWTVTSGLNASTAKWGTSSNPSTAISSSSTKCVNGATGNVYFKNLRPTANGSVTLTANWTAVIPLSTALDNTALTFTTGGSANWFGQSGNTHDGTDAARSGAITHNQNSWMQTTVTGPGTFSFWWYASCEGSTYDYLSFSVDDVQTNKIGGTSCSWTQCSYTLGAGTHSLKWNYRKDGSVNSGLDAGFVDQVTWTPGGTPVPTTYQVTFVKGLGVSAIYYRLGDSGTWTLYTAPFSAEKYAVVYYYVTPMSGYTVSYSSANPVHVTITGIATINVEAAPIPKTLYVSADGSDAQSGDEGAPLATIQKAISLASEGDLILVDPGTYAPITTSGKAITIRGTQGAGVTIIDGGWTNRCAHLGATTNTVLENLTLRNGAAGYWSPYGGYVRYEEDGGGAYGGTLVNCHVIGNKARQGGGCANTVLRSCKICGNAATRYGGGAYYSSSLRNCLAADGCCFFDNTVGVIEHYGIAAGSALYVDFASQVKVRNCIVAENECGLPSDGGAIVAYRGADGCVVQNCTIVNNQGGMSGVDWAAGVTGCSMVNSIVRFNYDEAGRESDIPEYVSLPRLTISSCCVSALPRSGYTGSGNTTADPKFVDLARHVYRLQAGSPCLDAGVSVSDAGATDAMGRTRIAGNRIDMGACEGAASGAVVTCEVVGEGLVPEPGDVLAPNESIVFTAVETKRRFVNFTDSNGATTADKVIRLSNVASDTTVVATFERVTFYVDASRPDDLGDGLSWETAKKTIAAALALCALSDEVIVADGTYGAFTVSVEGVTIRSVNGPERTVIDADGKSRCVDFSTPDGGEIVATLEGFTLCNGQTAYAGGGAYGGILKRCIVRGNVAGTSGGGLYGSRAENTVIVRNTAETFGGGAAYATLVSCSVAGNRTNGEEGGGLYYGQAVNTVVWGNEANGTTDEYSGGSFTNCVTSPLPSGAGNRSGDPRLVDAVNGDVRLRTGSPLKDAGNPSFVAGALDVFGNARVQGSAVDVGAIEGGEVSGHVISVRVKGVGEVSPRTAVVSDGGSVTLMAVETSRPFSHYLLYGLKFSGREQTLTDLMSDLTVTAVFTPYTFYVDAAAKTSGDGLSWATAKRTIQEAVDVAETDETVHVAPGIYSPISTHNKRIVIDSEKGPAVTVIDGGQTNRCATLADNSSGRATVLRGFTLTHGRLAGETVYGGGAYAGTLDRCIVSNCQLLGTSSSSWGQGAGLAYSKAFNTLIVNNVASNHLSRAGTYYADLMNCTVTGNRAVDGTGQYGGTYYGTADNCIIWGNEGGDRNNSYGTTLKYCCVDSSSTSRGTGCVVADPQFVDAASGDYRLAIDSPCIDAGLLGGADVGEVDLDGLARVVNGAIDIGAYEWQNGVVIPRSSEAAVVIPLDWFSTGKIGGLSVFSPSHFAALFGTDYAIAAKKPTGKVDAHGNPMYVWQDFVAGTDPTDKTSEFKASISFEDGKPVITWTPDLNEGGTRSIRTYRTLGIDDLSQSADPAAWREVTPGSESAYRFFKVEVELK